jgi:hypothetical protein
MFNLSGIFEHIIVIIFFFFFLVLEGKGNLGGQKLSLDLVNYSGSDSDSPNYDYY